MKTELTEEEEWEAAREASLKQMAEDEARRWAMVLADVAQEQAAAAVLEP